MDLTELRRTIISCKESITSATQDLTKLTGRNYDKSLDVNRHFPNSLITSRDNYTNNIRLTMKRRNSYENENPVDVKRSRADKEIPSLNSVVQMTKGRTRNDAIHDLKTLENPKEKERCKRLFGHLMGTLNSIKKESEKSTNDAQQITRLKIEKKVEEDHKIISETIQREQNELIRAKKTREFELKNLNQRYRAAEAFERWRSEKEKMKGFIRTSKPPYIFYKPRIINEEAQLRLDETAREIDLLIETRKKKLETDIDRVVKRHQNLTTGDTLLNESEVNNITFDEAIIGSTVSVVINNLNGKERDVSPAHSFASEDYDDMIEEIEITMHDEPVAVLDDTDRTTADMESSYEDKEPKKTIRKNKIVDKKVDIADQKFDIEDQKVDFEDQKVDFEDQKVDIEDIDKVMVEAECIIAEDEQRLAEEGNNIERESNPISDVPESSQN